MSDAQSQSQATADRGITPANQSAPAAEESEWGGNKPDLSNDAEEKLFRPGDA